MFIVIIRTLILYSVVLVTFRIMGKRQVGELQPFELAITIMISALAAIPMEDTSIPLINSLIPIFLLQSLQIYIAVINTKSSRARSILCGKPTVLIENGLLNITKMKENRINVHELLEGLRIKGYSNIGDVETAYIETNGQISVIPKSQKRPVNPQDLNINTDYEGVPHSLIVDGRIYYKNLEKINLTTEWLKDELSEFGIKDLSEVFFASIDASGNLFYQTYQGTST